MVKVAKGFALQRVGTTLSKQLVTAIIGCVITIAHQRIVATTAVDRVAPTPAFDVVVSCLGADGIATRSARDLVVSGGANYVGSQGDPANHNHRQCYGGGHQQDALH